MKKNLFVAQTIYQFLVCITIREYKCLGEQCDIVLTSNAIAFKEIIKSSGIKTVFDNIYYQDYSKLKYKHKNRIFQFAYECFKPKNIIKSVMSIVSDDYTDIYYYNPNELIYSFYRLYGEKIKFHSIEDGVISYIRAEFPKGTKPLYKKILIYLSRKYSIYDLKYDIYLFEPKCFVDKIKYSIIKIPQINKNDMEFVNKVNSSFGYHGEKISEKYIFFEESLDAIFEKEKYYQIVEYVAKHVGYENFILKRHPRNQEPLHNSNIKILESSVAWEVFCINTDLENKVLLSCASSACYNPKILFGSSVKTIMLYRLIDNKINICAIPNFIHFIKNIQTIYHNFYIVSDFNELLRILDT